MCTILARLRFHYTGHGGAGTLQANHALSIEQVTTRKKNSLILNVDGCIGVLLVDLLKELRFTDTEIDEMIQTGFSDSARTPHSELRTLLLRATRHTLMVDPSLRGCARNPGSLTGRR